MIEIKENTNNDSSEMMSVKFWINYLYSKKVLIIIISFLAAVIGGVYCKLKDPSYLAQLSFVPETESKSGLGSYSSLAAQFGIDVGGGGNIFEGDNIIELFKSNTLIIKTLLTKIDFDNKSQSLMDYYLSTHKISSKIEKQIIENNIKFNLSSFDTENRIRDSILNLYSNSISKESLKVDRKDKKLNIIIVEMTDKDEKFAKKFIECLTFNAIKYYTEYKTKKSKQNVDILQHQADSVKGTLMGSITDVASLNDLNVNPNKQIVRVGSQKRSIDVQVSSAIYVEILKNLELAKITLRKETPFIQIIDSPTYPLENKKKGMLFGGIISSFIFFFLTIFGLAVKKILTVLK